MIKGMEFTGLEDKEENKDKVNHCPVCGVNGEIGTFCPEHLSLIRNYEWVKNYINSLEEYDRKTVHILESAISDRKSYIINDVPVVGGKLQIEEYLRHNLYVRLDEGKKVKCSIWMEKILKEIMALEKAKVSIEKMIKEE